MRSSLLAFLVVIQFLYAGQPCSAQDARPDHADTAAKDVGRVGSLSPDEARRAARARARAATAAGKTAPAGIAARIPQEQSAPSRNNDVTMHRDRAPRPASKDLAALPANPIRRTRQTFNRPAPSAYVQQSQDGLRAPSRRRRAVAALRGPRVGDAVPPGVRLFRVPPVYGPAPVYRETAIDPRDAGWRYPPYPMYRAGFYRAGFPPYPVYGY